MTARVVYNPPEPHQCPDPPDGTLRDGAIAQCTECGGYSTLVARTDGRSAMWMRMDSFEVFVARVSGRISGGLKVKGVRDGMSDRRDR